MSKINVSITLNQNAISKIKEAARPALEMTMDALATEIENRQVVPFRDGILKDSEYHGILHTQDVYTIILNLILERISMSMHRDFGWISGYMVMVEVG